MPSLFGDLLDSLVKASRYGDIKAFSKVAGCSQAQLSRIRTGARRPPLDKLDAWADALGLDEGSRERDQFIHWAYMEHAPDQVRKIFEAQQALIESLTGRVESLEKQWGK